MKDKLFFFPHSFRSWCKAIILSSFIQKRNVKLLFFPHSFRRGMKSYYSFLIHSEEEWIAIIFPHSFRWGIGLFWSIQSVKNNGKSSHIVYSRMYETISLTAFIVEWMKSAPLSPFMHSIIINSCSFTRPV